MWQDTVRWTSLWVIACVPLFFLDAPFRTLGQTWVLRRGHERIVVLSMEFNFIILWALFKYYLKWDPVLPPGGLASALTVAGALLVACGAVLTVWGKLRLGRWFSATFGVKAGHQLVTDGPYAITRHPIYSGLLLMLFGQALVWGSLLTLLLAVVLSVTLFFHTVYEELLFEQHFGSAYRDYCRRVPRLVPFVPPGGAT